MAISHCPRTTTPSFLPPFLHSIVNVGRVLDRGGGVVRLNDVPSKVPFAGLFRGVGRDVAHGRVPADGGHAIHVAIVVGPHSARDASGAVVAIVRVFARGQGQFQGRHQFAPGGGTHWNPRRDVEAEGAVVAVDGGDHAEQQ